MDSIPGLCTHLQELQVRRKFWIALANKETNAAGALARRYCGFDPDANEKEREGVKKRAARIVERALKGKPQTEEDAEVGVYLEPDFKVLRVTLKPLTNRRNEIELEMKHTVRKLPVREWAKEVAGLGEIGVAVIIGECGDLNGYPNFRHVWKRLGYAPYEGRAMSRWKMEGGLSADEWTKAGYSPHRHAQIYSCVTEPMIKHQLVSAKKSETDFGAAKGPYGEVYIMRRAKCMIEHSDWNRAHLHKDALFVMTKAVLADLWRVWTGPSAMMQATVDMATSTFISVAAEQAAR